LKVKGPEEGQRLLDRIEHISNDIQLLALNIAVAAAKMAQRQQPGLEVHQKLSQLVNQATQTVKHMNRIITAARVDSEGGTDISDSSTGQVDEELIRNIESAMEAIISDSEKITSLLSGIKQR
jgi:hypothetical protein